MRPIYSFVWLTCVLGHVIAAPLPDSESSKSTEDDSPKLGIVFEGGNDLPILKLPYATYRAKSYDPTTDLYTFKNIRFAAAPLGPLRFKKPHPPLDERKLGVQPGEIGNSCVQMLPKVGLNLLGDGAFQPWAPSVNGLINGVANVLVGRTGDEDCLFLDLTVPGKALKNPGKTKLPVANWIYGGAYTLGAKEQFGLYNPSALMKAAGNNMIWVAGNYRLGVFGWLAGKTVEKTGTSNVGLHDQRAVLQWIQDYIHLVGGDKNSVTAMGESAGASSILHHLVAFGGNQDPLFHQAVLESPAFQIMWDRNELMERYYKQFLRTIGCGSVLTGPEEGLECARQVSTQDLRRANEAVQDLAPRGTFGIGPSSDGSWIRQLAGVELLQGNHWRGLKSMIVTHTAYESTIFVDGAIQTDEQFTKFLTDLFPEFATREGLIGNLTAFYPPVKSSACDEIILIDADRNQRGVHIKTKLRESGTLFETRHLPVIATLTDTGKTYNLQYSQWPGWHGTDLLANFLSPESDGVDKIVGSFFNEKWLDLFDVYKAYMAAYITKGDPNAPLDSSKNVTRLKRIPWNKAAIDPKTQDISNVLDLGDNTVKVIEDRLLPKSNCDFMILLEEKGIHLAGVAPDPSKKPKFDQVYGGKVPKVKIETVVPFPADIAPAEPFDSIAQRLANTPMNKRLDEVFPGVVE